jgi:hypothetical protein
MLRQGKIEQLTAEEIKAVRKAIRINRKIAAGKTCGARTRKGTPCVALGSGRGRRCKNHGGLSTGPKTPAGWAKSLAALRWYAEKRWAEERCTRLALPPFPSGGVPAPLRASIRARMKRAYWRRPILWEVVRTPYQIHHSNRAPRNQSNTARRMDGRRTKIGSVLVSSALSLRRFSLPLNSIAATPGGGRPAPQQVRAYNFTSKDASPLM